MSTAVWECPSGGDWFAYLEPPARMPGTAQSINWRYLLVGRVDLTTGEIEEALRQFKMRRE
jgi:hypothetical protein